jgi:hypothetical protein
MRRRKPTINVDMCLEAGDGQLLEGIAYLVVVQLTIIIGTLALQFAPIG